jgi:S1-C subfamily serine protease
MKISSKYLWLPLALLAWIIMSIPAWGQDQAPDLGKKIGPAIVQVVAYDAGGKVLRTGSGFFISPDGRLLTAWYVLLGASRAAVKTAAGQEHLIQTVVAGDAKTGLLLATAGPLPGPVAHLSLEPQLPQAMAPVTLVGASSKAQPIVEDGSVFSLLDYPDHGKVIQVSMPITTGLWGAPVANAAGKVVGVALSGTLGAQPINFAVPAAQATSLKEEVTAFPYWAEGHFLEALERCYKKAAAAERANNQKQATGWYQEAVRIKPEDARARNKLGVAFYREGRHKEALEEFRQAVRFKADDPQYHLNLGLAALKTGQRPEAEKTMEVLNRLDPKMAQKLEASLKAPSGTPTTAVGAPAPEALPELFNRIKPAVVFVEKYDAHHRRASTSSGFFINGQGHFITNYHCLRGGSSATVKTSDGKSHPVKLILAEDKFNDLILAAIDPPPGGTPYLPVNGVLPQIGEEVVNLGNPKGLEWTLSTGIVSAIRGWPTPQRQVVQFTAPISHGSSGSPILNRKGQVVAVNAMTIESGQNLNFGPPAKFVLALKPGPGKNMEQRAQEWLASAQDLTRQGEEYLQKKDIKKAYLAFKDAIEDAPDYARAHVDLAYTYFLDNNQEGFKKEYAVVQKLDAKLAKDLAKYTTEAESGTKKAAMPNRK